MTRHTDSAHQVCRLEVVDTGRRRRWSFEEKLRIVEESHQGHRQVSATARRHGISASLLFSWRRDFREGRLGGIWCRRWFFPILSCRLPPGMHERNSEGRACHAGSSELRSCRPNHRRGARSGDDGSRDDRPAQWVTSPGGSLQVRAISR